MTPVVFYAGLVLRLAPWLGEARATEIASGVAAAARTREEAVLLIVTDEGESSFRKSVQTCAVTGDGGRAISGYQLHPRHLHRFTKEQVCANHALASRLALRALSGPGDVRARIAAFMGRKRTDREVERRAATYERLLAAAQGES